MSESTVFIVDDDPGIRQSLTRLMQEINQPTQSFASAAEFLEAYDPASAGCLVLDVRMPEMSGTELQKKLVAADRTIPIIMITGHGDIPMAVEAVQMGAVTFLQKPVRSQQLIDCIQRALSQGAERRRSEAEHSDAAARVATLSPREREVIDLAVSGLNNKEIAAELGVSPQAIDSRRTHAMAKLGVNNIPCLVKMMLLVNAA